MSYQCLNPLKDNTPYNVLSLDAEWDSDNNVYVWCIWGHYKGKTIEQTFFEGEKDKVVNFLFKKRWRHTILTGMNLQVDLNTLIYKGGFDWTPLLSSGNFITALPDAATKEKYGNGTLLLMDIHNFFPSKGLKALAESFDINDTYIDKHEIAKFSKVEMYAACMSHAKTGVLVMEHIQKLINGLKSNLCITPALTAQTLHRRVYLHEKAQILGHHCSLTESDKLFHFKSYYGGRTENFTRGAVSEVCGIDINSSYPNVMRNNQFPNMSTYHEQPNTSIDELLMFMAAKKNGNYRYEGLATVIIKAPEKLDIPLLPLRDNGKILFPLGTWKGTYVFPELRKALELGYTIIDVLECGTAGILPAPIFKDFVDGLYHLKKDKKYKPMAKLMLNSLYGKFGQKANESSGWIPLDDEDEVDVNDPDKKHRVINGKWFQYQKPTQIEERGFANKAYPLIASYVTAYSRLFLYNVMALIGIEALYYVDTDSIYCDIDKLIEVGRNGDIPFDSDNLGAWDVEHYDITIDIRGLKYYRIFENDAWEYRIKGVPKRGHEEYWVNRCIDMERYVKYQQGIRGNKVLNSVYNQTRSDQNPDSKRFFINSFRSIPKTINYLG